MNGQKTWNSLGRHADWCQLYVRTDPEAPKHKGISCLLVDMGTPGIEVRPVRTMAGDLTFSELFFTESASRGALLGALHGGWRVAMATLSHERAGVARLHLSLARASTSCWPRPGAARRSPTRWCATGWPPSTAGSPACGGARPASCTRSATGHAPSPTMGSLTKLMWSLTEQQLAELAVDLMGLDGLSGRWAKGLASSRQSTIAGGTTEINRNILAEHGLGLPRELRHRPR